MGGINYFLNLFNALNALPSRSIEPVIISGYGADQAILAGFCVREKYRSAWNDAQGIRWKVRRASTLWFGRDVWFETVLKKSNIALLSHGGYLGFRSNVPSMPWIPDFQERFLPDFFSAAEIRARELENERICKHATAILLSSNDALDHLKELDSTAAQRASVLQFVATVPPRSSLPSRAELDERYSLPERYIFLPNQFWAHKNHALAVRALEYLRERHEFVKIVVTGNPSDHRQPLYFAELMELIRKCGVGSSFITLGIVPYRDLMALMRHSVAVLNPSLFEGWSTTIEEAKSMGKLTLLSNIAVHREQNPLRHIYFSPADPVNLANAMLEAWETYSVDQDEKFIDDAERLLPQRMRDFALRYQEIVNDVLPE